MELTKTKNCPFCGEEIMATAKKCKHCGEWLVMQQKFQQQQTNKESYFNPEYLYDSSLMKILFGITIFGSLVLEMHSCGMSGGKSIFRFIIAMPIWLGVILRIGGELAFLFLLKNAMNIFHKPLKGLFWWNIIWLIGWGVLLAVVADLVVEDSSDEETTIGIGGYIIMYCIIYLPLGILGASIIGNYEDSIKKLGQVILIFIGISILIDVVDNLVSGSTRMFMSFLTILVETFYFSYLRDVLSKD